MEQNGSSKVWTAEEIKARLAATAEFRKHALLAIFDRQTAQEQDAMRTTDLNGRGFTGWDAELLTSFAQQLQTRGYLSPKQDAILSKRLPKYSTQLARIANGEL